MTLAYAKKELAGIVEKIDKKSNIKPEFFSEVI